MQKRKKIYYSAGLISIIMLPILCLISIKTNDAYKIYYCMDFQGWDGLENTDSFKNNITYLNTKKFSTVTLTGNNDSDKIKLEEAQKNIKNLVTLKDSVNGIKFHFEPKSQYWTYVKALEIIQVAQAYSYFCYKDDILFTNPKPIKTSKYSGRTIRCISGELGQRAEQNQPKITWQKTKIFLQITKEMCKKYYLLITAYVLMVFFTFRRIVNEKN
jgi:hypothetical protein